MNKTELNWIWHFRNEYSLPSCTEVKNTCKRFELNLYMSLNHEYSNQIEAQKMPLLCAILPS